MLEHQSSNIDRILAHLCEKGVYGDVAEWCEMRNDCVIVVTCPDCEESYTIDDVEYEALLRLSREQVQACGIRPID